MPIDTFSIYRGMGSPAVSPPSEPVKLPSHQRHKLTDPAGYLADPGLVDAVNVALHLGKPLLLTGEAGTGKTTLAASLAWELGYALEVYETKSSSVASDLFYTYNALAHFNVAQIEGRRATAAGAEAAELPERIGLRYLRYNALGRAIIRSCSRAKVEHVLPPGFEHPGDPSRSVVLLDEIDKSPRDLPNDVLSAIDAMAFSVPELGNARVQADPEFRPVLVLSSNSEKALPDPFLRRCIFYHIPVPEGDDLKKIITARLGAMAEQGSLLADALDLFGRLRKAPGLRKRPATAELLDWLVALQMLTRRNVANPLRGASETIVPTLTCLVKTVEDRPLAAKEVDRWRAERL
jgi:MoxR-like ATPase